MNTISDIMFWISNGLLVPVVVLLILLFFRSLLLVGNFFGQYVSIRKTDKLIREQMDKLHVNNVDDFANRFWRNRRIKPNYNVFWLILKLLPIRIWLLLKRWES